MSVAERDGEASREHRHHVRRRSRGWGPPEALGAGEPEALRVAELAPVAELVLDHPSPKRRGPDHRGTRGSREQRRILGQVQAAPASKRRCAVEPSAPARGSRRQLRLPRSPVLPEGMQVDERRGAVDDLHARLVEPTPDVGLHHPPAAGTVDFAAALEGWSWTQSIRHPSNSIAVTMGSEARRFESCASM